MHGDAHGGDDHDHGGKDHGHGGSDDGNNNNLLWHFKSQLLAFSKEEVSKSGSSRFLELPGDSSPRLTLEARFSF